MGLSFQFKRSDSARAAATDKCFRADWTVLQDFTVMKPLFFSNLAGVPAQERTPCGAVNASILGFAPIPFLANIVFNDEASPKTLHPSLFTMPCQDTDCPHF
jgi:hypothetical protein